MTFPALTPRLIANTQRVPAPYRPQGKGGVIARQLDVALMKVGFKLSRELLEHLSSLHPTVVAETAEVVFTAVRQTVGDHVQHNVYFRDFPRNVPDTLEFWERCIDDALSRPGVAERIRRQVSLGIVNLLDLPRYGRYQHSYAEMLEAHEGFIPSLKDRMTVLHLGKTLAEEVREVYWSLASSSVPLSEDDCILLGDVAEVCLADPQPELIPMRENRAIINAVRVLNGYVPLVDSVPDLLRLAVALSGGDVTLQAATPFTSFPRRVRRTLLEALEGVVAESPGKLADVNRHPERWKRLGERLHPHEFPQWPHAVDVFAVARGDKTVRTLAAQIELAFAAEGLSEALELLSRVPGMLFRNLDRLVLAASEEELPAVFAAIEKAVERVPSRLILSVREHLQNRSQSQRSRIFLNRRGRAWVQPETRDPLPVWAVEQVTAVLDAEMLRRLPVVHHLVVDPAVLTLALPLSDKSRPGGFGILPRGSTTMVAGDILRFFVYWKQASLRTDYDLSVLMLDDNFQIVGQRSWTNLGDSRGVALHSGDITEAANGATEFIDVDLDRVECAYIVPQVNIYSGESFLEVAECFFGYMERSPEQKGKPFEPAAVRVKSDLAGRGRVALPLVFARTGDGTWIAHWMHLCLAGRPSMNRVEANRISVSLLAETSITREYLTFDYLVGLLRRQAAAFSWYDPRETLVDPVTFVGLVAPEGLPAGSPVFTTATLGELIPA